MIVAWKKRGPLELVANWQGLSLRLAWNVPQEQRWRLWVDGALVRQGWADVHAAQAEIDGTILRLITVAAAARLGPERMVQRA